MPVMKHGGHERVSDLTGNLIAPDDCEFKEEGKFIVLTTKTGELRYPRPSNWVGLGKEEYKKGEIIGTAYNTTSPVYKLNATIKMLNAAGSVGKKYFEKDNVIVSDCYAYEDGVIHYIEDKAGNIDVQIGGKIYPYCDEAMYYYPDGTSIKKYQRFCSGVANLRQVANDFKDDVNSVFIIFRDQYYMLQSPSFQSTHIVSEKDMQEEIIELVFAGLTKMMINPDTNKVDGVDYLGVRNSVLGRDSFFTTLSYGYAKQTVGKALKGELNIADDIMTETVLGLLLNEQL